MQIPFEMSWTNTGSEFQESFDGFWGEVSKGDGATHTRQSDYIKS